MFDIDILRKNRPLVEEMLRKRSTTIDLDRILELDRRRAELVRASNDLREERNKPLQPSKIPRIRLKGLS